MGYYLTTCPRCGHGALFYSIGSTWVDCPNCKAQAPNNSPRGGIDQPSPPDAGPATTVQGGGAGGVPPPFEFTGTCDVCKQLVSDGRMRHRACEPASRQGEPLSYDIKRHLVSVTKELVVTYDRATAAERERDEETAKLADVRALHAMAIEQVQFMHGQASRCSECSGWNGVTTFCDDCYCRDVDEAIATERARCVELSEAYRDDRIGSLVELTDAIRNGTPAPKGPTE